MNQLSVLQDVALYSPEKGSLPYLIRYQECDWDAVIGRSKTHPLEVRINERGNDVFDDPVDRCSVLHDVLFHHRPPVEAVDALISAETTLLYHKYWEYDSDDDEEEEEEDEEEEEEDNDDFFYTPLRIACAARYPPHDAKVLSLLLERTVAPLSLFCNDCYVPLKCNPLSFMYDDKCTPEQLEMLLNIFPLGAVGEFFGEKGSALDRLLLKADPSYRFCLDLESTWRKFLLLIKASDRVLKANPCTPVHSFLRRLCAGGLLRSFKTFGEAGGYIDEPSNWNLVPALKRFAEENADFFKTKDDLGRLPLHFLLEHPVPYDLTNAVLEEMVEVLLFANPSAAQTLSRSGRLPLHIALENGWPWRAILQAAPHAMTTWDTTTRLFPFQLAATHGSQSEQLVCRSESAIVAMRNTFEVLREDPTVLSHFLRGVIEQDIDNATEKIKQLKKNLHALELEIAWKRRRLES